MPKMKTNKAAAKRIKVTGTGKLMRRTPGTGHLRSVKSPSRRRRFRSDSQLSKGFARTARRLLGL